MGDLEKIVHLGRDPELLRNNNSIAEEHSFSCKIVVKVLVGRSATDHRSVGTDHKDALWICFPSGAASVVQMRANLFVRLIAESIRSVYRSGDLSSAKPGGM